MAELGFGIVTAIVEIRKAQDGGHAQISVNAEDLDQITWLDGNPTNITNQQITDKQAALQTAYNARQYQRDRALPSYEGGYPSIGDQLDMIYHDQVDGTTTFKDAIKAIKDAHSKP